MKPNLKEILISTVLLSILLICVIGFVLMFLDVNVHASVFGALAIVIMFLSLCYSFKIFNS